jgi:NADPH-dependent 7-cyano-7-deazaguanine reductase QueF
VIATILNAHPDVPIVIRLTTPYNGACPHSGEPQAGSVVVVEYRPGERLLELHAVQSYLVHFSEGSEPVDLETVVQQTARDCAAALEVVVTVEARYVLKGGIELQCSSTYQS